ncbi:hypothetical protein A4A49_17679 [Nicotiana attenuata]|uniref:Uncharacterized protein n=1 Tax=Nicotiana attenuata TaxID=49451 RepID=A0A1J6HRS9_NICAT|nr:hypothetical protein A4A49_17679 [Nicotiana attenuata]
MKTTVGKNRAMAPYGSRGNDQGVSKPSFVAAVQAKLPVLNDGTSSIEIRHGTYLGKPAVFFTAQDYFVTLAQDCKLTLKDYNHILFKEYVDIGEAPMKILEWTTDFRPEEETSIVPVWILIHQLPWHLFRWQVISKLVSDVGVAVGPDQATYSKSRGNIAKIKVEIDLLKPRLDQIWLGFNLLDGTEDGRWLEIEYEKVPSYCLYCKLQGHLESQCRNKIRDERVKVQREEQYKREKESKIEKKSNDEEGYQIVTRKRG